MVRKKKKDLNELADTSLDQAEDQTRAEEKMENSSLSITDSIKKFNYQVS